MSPFDLNLVGNPRTDRPYIATLSTQQSLPCRSADFGEGHASLSLSYTPIELCIETRSFGRYLGHLLQESELDQELLVKIVGDVVRSCHPSAIQVEAHFESPDGIRISLQASHPHPPE